MVFALAGSCVVVGAQDQGASSAGQSGSSSDQPAASVGQDATAAPAPASRPVPQASAGIVGTDYVVSPVRVQTFPGKSFLCGTEQTTLGGVPETGKRILAALQQAAATQGLQLNGPTIFIYPDLFIDPNTPFALDVGYAVPDNTQAPASLQVKKLEPFRCVTVLYNGPMAQVGQAYASLVSQIEADGYTPTGELRQMFLYWEGPESANNIVQIQMGIQ
jgi:effector-binding domain-containing protein